MGSVNKLCGAIKDTVQTDKTFKCSAKESAGSGKSRPMSAGQKDGVLPFKMSLTAPKNKSSQNELNANSKIEERESGVNKEPECSKEFEDSRVKKQTLVKEGISTKKQGLKDYWIGRGNPT